MQGLRRTALKRRTPLRRTALPRVSTKGDIVKAIDALLFKILKLKRGDICEIHGRKCPGIGPMHLLSKQSHPRLLAGWFCSHYWTHHNNDDPRAQYTYKRIEELRGKEWRKDLITAEVYQPKLTLNYLMFLRAAFTQVLEEFRAREGK
jgi:hypothetical protein